jgi:hypothetical protein
MSSLNPVEGETQEQCDDRLRRDVEVRSASPCDKLPLVKLWGYRYNELEKCEKAYKLYQATDDSPENAITKKDHWNSVHIDMMRMIFYTLQIYARFRDGRHVKYIPIDEAPLDWICPIDLERGRAPQVARLECGHIFGIGALTSWIYTRREPVASWTPHFTPCPLCRRVCDTDISGGDFHGIRHSGPIRELFDQLMGRLYPHIQICDPM